MSRNRVLKNVNKKNADEVFVFRNGFKKHSEPFSYSKWHKGKRIHFKLGKRGFEYHIDHH